MSGQEAHEPDRMVATSPARRGRYRLTRWGRRLALCVLGLCVLLALGLWVVTRSWFIVWQLTPMLERKLGGKVHIAKAVYHGGGKVTFEGVTLRAEGLRGPAAEIAQISNAEIEVDLSSLMAGDVRIRDADLSGITVRVSEDVTQTGRMNFMDLHPKVSGGGKTPPPSRVSIRDLTLEVGTHIADQFILNGRRRLAGEMHPMAGDQDLFSYELREVDERGQVLGERGLEIKGEWNARSTDGNSRIERLALDERIYRMLPRQARLWWNRMDLVGNVDEVTLDWNAEQSLAVRFSVNDVAMTMPLDVSEVWTVYRNGALEPTTSRPRMNVHSGVIRVGTDSLSLEELRGELVSAAAPSGDGAPATSPATQMVGVPYEISLKVPKLPTINWDDPEQWMEEALKTSAFELTARMDKFSLAGGAQGDAQAVGLPTIVAKVLAKFQTRNWELSTSVRVARANPTIDDHGTPHAAPLAVTGQAYINNATGSYQKFPYLMEDVDAYLQFTDRRVNVEYLQARGSDGSTFRITGYIEPPDKDASFHLELTGSNVPLDDRFRAALRPNELKAVDAMFSKPSTERMARGGTLPDQRMLDQQAGERDVAVGELARLRRAPDADAAEVQRLEQRIAALERSIKAGPFVNGGVVDLQLTLDRSFGASMPTSVNGVVNVRNAGLIFDRFPYPLRGSGKLLWESDRVTIESTPDNPGIRFVTPAGGYGVVNGSVAFPRNDTGGRKIQPDLNFVIEDDPVNDAVFAAIPYGKTELSETPRLAVDWPGAMLSRAGRIVKGIGLGGAYDYRGHIGAGDDGKYDWDFRVILDGGTAAPNRLLADAVRARDLPWPVGLVLTNLKGDVRVQRQAVTWNEITGDGPEAMVSASGSIGMSGTAEAPAKSSVSIRIDNAPIDRSALNMVSSANARKAEELWDRFQPVGRMDALIDWRSDSPPGEGGVLTLKPREVSMRLGTERVALSGRGGEARISGQSATFDRVAMDLASFAAPHGGTLSVDGRWDFAGAAPGFDLNGAWTGGRFESPLIPEALRLFGQERQASRYNEFEPTGALELAYHVARAGPDAPAEYLLQLTPQTVDFTLRGTRLQMEIANGDIDISPGLIAFNSLKGRAASGEFGVSGSLTTLEPMETQLAIDYAGMLNSEPVKAFLPRAVNDALAALEFRDAAPGRISNAALRLRRSGDAASDLNWQTEFTGRVEARKASFIGGLQFSDVDGTLDLDVAHESGRPMRLSAVGRATHAIVLGQELYDVEAPMLLNDAGDALLIPTAQARCGDGVVAASASSGVGARRDYAMRVDLVGVPLINMIRPNPASQPGASPDDAAAATASPSTRQKPVSGQAYASLTLSGERGDAPGRRGRGVIRVLNGHLSAIPLALQAMQVMQLTLPVTGDLDFADAEMYVIGDIAHFERILFESSVGQAAALQLIGEGTLDLRTMEIAARFRPRSGVAILRDIIGGIGDMLYEIELTGPLREPRARIVPLP